MNNPPIKMMFQESPDKMAKPVLVYDFIHNPETFDSFALCWSIEGNFWWTVPVFSLTPILESEKKTLIE